MDSKNPGRETLSHDLLKQISKLIKDSTHTNKHPEKKNLDRLAELCRSNPGYVHHAFTRIMVMLKENHSEIRLNCIYLCDHLFLLFNTFRELLSKSFEKFFLYTFGPDFNQELPEPRKAAHNLIKLTIQCLDRWHLKYGGTLKQLDEVYVDLKDNRNVDFKTFEFYNPIERTRRIAEERKCMEINQKLLLQIEGEMNSLSDEINDAIKSFDSCLELIIPSPENFTRNKVSGGEIDDNLRVNGIYNYNNNNTIEIYINSCSKIEIIKTEDNCYLLENAKDVISSVKKKYLPKTKAWHVLLEKVRANEEKLQKASELVHKLETIIDKYAKLRVIDKSKVIDDEVSTDSELEEVEDMKPPEVKFAKNCTEERNFLETPCVSFEKPGTSTAYNSKDVSSYSERKQKLLSIAPKLPFSMDLYHWEDDGPKTETLLPTSIDGHRFWASSSIESIEVPTESIRSRIIEFSGKFEPVTRACSAPLPSGKLCPRHDRYKCPLHGVIVPRDEKGNFIDPSDEKLAKTSTYNPDVPDWQDPKLLAEIKACTGLDLEIKKGKRTPKKKSELTEIKKKLSSKEKLAKKVFNKKSLKRVAKTLDSLDYKRYRDKFGDQFNYSHGS